MGTRHLIVVVHQGRWVVAQYGQWDGYPEVAGMKLLKLLAAPGFLQKLRDGLAYTYEVSDAEVDELYRASAAARERLDKSDWPVAGARRQLSPLQAFLEDPLHNYSPELLDMHPSLHRDTSAAVLALIAHAGAANTDSNSTDSNEKDAPQKQRRVPLLLQPEFANDTLFCEWAYVVDLDADVLEVFEGGEKKTPEHRFVNVGRKGDLVPTFIASVPFADLEAYSDGRKDFVEMVSHEIDCINALRAGDGGEEEGEDD